jgi:FeS assembly SUF system protein
MTEWPLLPDDQDAAAAQPADQSTELVPDPLAELELKPKVIEALSTVYDPEIPVNIYELGLVYDIVVTKERLVGIRMTLTAPACPAAQYLPIQVREQVRAIPGVTDVRVEVVWDPPWSIDKMSEAAKLQLGLI